MKINLLYNQFRKKVINFADLHKAKSIFLKGDRSEILLIELLVVLLKLDPSIAESIDIENVSIVSVVAKDIGEFDTGKDMLRSNLKTVILIM